MQINISFISKILSLGAFVGSCLWSYFNFGFEPVIAAAGSLVIFIGLIANDKRKKSEKTISQIQRAGSHSTNYQAGGDVNINRPNDD